MPSETRTRALSAGCLLAVVAVTLVLFTPFCGVLHCCGCTPLWSGGEGRCNYQNATGPHCPWCEYRALGGAVAISMIGVEALVFRALAKRGVGRAASAAGALATFPLTGVVVGALAWGVTDYPHFLVEDARARLGLPGGPIPTYAHGPGVGDCCPGSRAPK